MPESVLPNRRRRLVLRLLKGLCFAAIFGIIWWQEGWPALVGVGLAYSGALAVRARISRSQKNRLASSPRHELVLSADPAEAARARAGLFRQFAAGVLYLVCVSMLLAALVGGHFLIVLAAVMASAFFTGAMLLAWAISRTETRQNQFSLSTLLILTTLAAVYLGLIRLLADWSGRQFGAGDRPFLAVAAVCLVLTCLTLPFLLLFMESLVWLATWLVRRPWWRR